MCVDLLDGRRVESKEDETDAMDAPLAAQAVAAKPAVKPPSPTKAKTEDTAEKKMQFWGKGDVSMDGIVAKMVVNPDWNKKLKTPLRLRPMSADGDIEAQSALWRAILMAKARADSEYRNLLEVSGDTFFVEFDRGARSAFLDTKKRNPFWTGLVDKESGELFGANFMGVCQMRNRDRLLREL